MSLLRQIQEAAIDSDVALPTLLRKCMVLASRLGSDEFKHWITHELSGYPDKELLPDYRVLRVHSKGHFSGPFGSGLRNADIPLSCVAQELREVLGHSYLNQSVAAMESLVKNKKSGTLEESWNPDIVAHVGQRIYRDMNCMQAWKVIPSSAIVAALDAVRTRILNFVLEIETQNPSAGESEPNSTPVPKEIVHQIYNTHIAGNVQNFAPGSTEVEQHAKYVERNDGEVLTHILEAIENARLPPDVVKSISEVIEGMKASQGTPSFRQNYQKFMSFFADHIQVLGPLVAPYLPVLSGMLS